MKTYYTLRAKIGLYLVEHEQGVIILGPEHIAKRYSDKKLANFVNSLLFDDEFEVIRHTTTKQKLTYEKLSKQAFKEI